MKTDFKKTQKVVMSFYPGVFTLLESSPDSLKIIEIAGVVFRYRQIIKSALQRRVERVKKQK